MSRIVTTTIGSLGDLHPQSAIASRTALPPSFKRWLGYPTSIVPAIQLQPTR